MRKIIIPIISLIIPITTFASTYGSNVITGGSMSSDSSDCGSGAGLAGITDGNLATYYCSATGLPKYVEYDMGSGKSVEIDKVSIAPYSDSGGAGIKNFTIAGSNDNSTWNTLITTTTANNTGSSQYQDFTIPIGTSSIAYRYFKLTITDSWRTTQQILFAEWQGYSCLDCQSGTSTQNSTYYSDQFNSYLSFIFDLIIIIGIALIIIWVFK